MPDADQIVTDALDQPDPGTEEFENAVVAEFESDAPTEEPQAEAPPSDATEEVEEPALDDAPPPSPEPAQSEFIDLGGMQVPADKAQALAEFWQWSQTPVGHNYLLALDQMQKAGIDPSQVSDGVVSRPPPPPPPEAELEDEYLDPATKRLHDDMRAMREELDQTRALLQSNQQSQVQAIIATASKRFGDEHGISAEDTQKLIDHVDRSVNLQGYATDPTTGLQRDQVSTLVAAMEAALWSNPEMRERELDRVKTEHAQRQKKDRKLAAVGGTSGSVPQKPQPNTPADREEEAVAMISEAMGMSK